ncbi:MAG: hypothetical protein AAGM22_05725 [Acidobacteriota bacterium]
MSFLVLAAPAAAESSASDQAKTAPEVVETAPATAEAPTLTPDVADVEAGVILRPIVGDVPEMPALVKVRDAETGDMRAPTPEEMARLQSTMDPLNRSDAGLVERHYPDGTIGVRLDGRFQSMSVVNRNPETGEITPTCTTSAHVVSHKLAATPEETEEDSDVR